MQAHRTNPEGGIQDRQVRSASEWVPTSSVSPEGEVQDRQGRSPWKPGPPPEGSPERTSHLSLLAGAILLLAPLVALAEDDAVLGQKAYEAGKYDEAVAHFERALENEDERSGQLCLALGNCYYQMKRWEAAIAAWQKGIALKAESADVHRSIAQAQILLGHLDDAVVSFSRAGVLDPHGRDAFWMAQVFAQMEDWIPAEREVVRHLETHPDSTEARELLGAILLRRGRAAEAAETYRVLVRRHPTEPRFRLWLAQAEADAKQAWAAIDALEAAVRLGSKEADTWRLLGDLYLAERMPREAAIAYERLIAATSDPTAEDWRRLGHARLDAGDSASAREAFEKAAAADAGAFDAAMQLAQLAEREGRAEDARTWYAAAMRASPSDRSPCLALARFEVSLGRWAEAAAAFTEAVRRGERAAEPLHDRAVAEFRAGNVEKAWEALKAGLREHPLDERLRALLKRLCE